MAEFICKLGTPGGEIVARTVEGMSEKNCASVSRRKVTGYFPSRHPA